MFRKSTEPRRSPTILAMFRKNHRPPSQPSCKVEKAMHNHVVGTPVPRKEGAEKVTGRAQYVDDLHHAQHDPRHHGAQPHRPMAEFKASPSPMESRGKNSPSSPAAGIPGKNAVTLILDDQPFLANGSVVNHPEEPVVPARPSRQGAPGESPHSRSPRHRTPHANLQHRGVGAARANRLGRRQHL